MGNLINKINKASNLVNRINKAANEISQGSSINGIPIYIDPHSETNNILVGRKSGQPKANYLVMNPEIYNILFEEEKINQERYDKLSKILNEILNEQDDL